METPVGRQMPTSTKKTARQRLVLVFLLIELDAVTRYGDHARHEISKGANNLGLSSSNTFDPEIDCRFAERDNAFQN